MKVFKNFLNGFGCWWNFLLWHLPNVQLWKLKLTKWNENDERNALKIIWCIIQRQKFIFKFSLFVLWCKWAKELKRESRSGRIDMKEWNREWNILKWWNRSENYDNYTMKIVFYALSKSKWGKTSITSSANVVRLCWSRTIKLFLIKPYFV